MYFKQLNVKLKAFNLTEEKCSIKWLSPSPQLWKNSLNLLFFILQPEPRFTAFNTLPTIKLWGQLFFFLSFFPSFLKVCLFVYVISTPIVGLELMTPRSRVACSSHWASQAPLGTAFLICHIAWSLHLFIRVLAKAV